MTRFVRIGYSAFSISTIVNMEIVGTSISVTTTFGDSISVSFDSLATASAALSVAVEDINNWQF